MYKLGDFIGNILLWPTLREENQHIEPIAQHNVEGMIRSLLWDRKEGSK